MRDFKSKSFTQIFKQPVIKSKAIQLMKAETQEFFAQSVGKQINNVIEKARKSMTTGPLGNKISVFKENNEEMNAVQEESDDSDEEDDCFSLKEQ